MKAFIDHLLGKADPQHGINILLQFKSYPQPLGGQLRKHPEFDGVYEFLCMVQEGPNAQPFGLTNFFTADSVERVMIRRDDVPSPKAVMDRTPGGIIIPS